MSYQTPLKDERKRRGVIWNVGEVLKKHPFGAPHAPWNKDTDVTEEEWLDEFVYKGFEAHGHGFLKALRGRFAVAFVDGERGRLFLARDWI